MNLGTKIWETLGQHRKMKINRETSRELAGYFVGVEFLILILRFLKDKPVEINSLIFANNVCESWLGFNRWNLNCKL